MISANELLAGVQLLGEQRAKQPVRLKVAYHSLDALLAEYTRSLGNGGVALNSRRAIARGTAFVFELHAKDLPKPVEVHGEVMRCNELADDSYLINISYHASPDVSALDGALEGLKAAHASEAKRASLRVPLHIAATEEAAYSCSYVVRDVSMGGLQLTVEATEVPSHVKMGTPFLLEIRLRLGTLSLHGEVVWLMASKSTAATLSPSVGIRFGKLSAEATQRLSQFLTLKNLPPPPWSARVYFGADAVRRMT